MARKKSVRKKKTGKKIAKTGKKRVAKRKVAAKRKAVARKKPVTRKPGGRSAKRRSAKKRTAAKKKSSAAQNVSRARAGVSSPVPVLSRRGLGAASGGQSGDTQGLSRRDYLDSESVEELMEEGQYMEAEALSGVENARDPDEGEVRTRQFPEDDVPEEYRNED